MATLSHTPLCAPLLAAIRPATICMLMFSRFSLVVSILTTITFGLGCVNTGAPRRSAAPQVNLTLDQRTSMVVGDSTPFHLLVTIDVPAAAESQFIYFANQAQTATRLEPGNLSYTFFRDAERAGRYYLFETWASSPELTSHLARLYTQDLLQFAASSKCKVQIEVLRPLAPGTSNLDQLPATISPTDPTLPASLLPPQPPGAPSPPVQPMPAPGTSTLPATADPASTPASTSAPAQPPALQPPAPLPPAAAQPAPLPTPAAADAPKPPKNPPRVVRPRP